MDRQIQDSSIENKDIVSILEEHPIIQSKDLKDLNDCKAFIVDTYLSVPLYRSLPIKILGVLSNAEFPTTQSKFWQCKVEAEVHANELIRDLHDLERENVRIKRNEFVLNSKMAKMYASAKDEIERQEIEFDMQEQKIAISRQKFEVIQLKKKIKYRISEVSEWKMISEKIASLPHFAVGNFSDMLIDSMREKWNLDLTNPKLTDEEKHLVKIKLTTLNQTVGLKPNNSNVNVDVISQNKTN